MCYCGQTIHGIDESTSPHTVLVVSSGAPKSERVSTTCTFHRMRIRLAQLLLQDLIQTTLKSGGCCIVLVTMTIQAIGINLAPAYEGECMTKL